jgi:hypothetical protein
VPAVRAIVVENLHVPLLLGLDFQVKNSLVMDAGTHSIRDKTNNYDLLNPPDITVKKKLEHEKANSPSQWRKCF